MKNMKKIAAALAATATALSCTISSFAYTAEDIWQTVRESAPINEECAIYVPVENPTVNLVNYYDWDTCEGIAVYCEDAEAQADFLDEMYAISYDTAIYFCMNNDAYGSSYTATFSGIPEEYADKTDNIYMLRPWYRLNMTSEEYFDCYRAIAENQGCEVLGAFVMHWHMPGNWGVTDDIHIEYAEGYSVDDVDWAAYGIHIEKSRYYDKIWYSTGLYKDDDAATLEAILALCEQLEALDAIAYAGPMGNYPVSAECRQAGGGEIVAIKSFGNGDLNGNGEIELRDAVLLARAVGGSYALDDTSRANADLNGDGTVNADDLTRLMQKLANM